MGQITKIMGEDAVDIGTVATVHLRMDASGNIGIGDLAPTYLIDAQAAVSVSYRAKCSGDYGVHYRGDSNRASDGQAILSVSGAWDGTIVGRIRVASGADTTNKDDGRVLIATAAAGVVTNALSVYEDQRVETHAGRVVAVARVTGNTTLTSAYHHVFADTDGGAITITLPAGAAGREFRVVNTGSAGNAVTVAPDGSELLLGANSNWTLADGEALVVVYETTEGWF